MFDVSIIIPVYNVEPYLSACLDSVLSMKELNTQIICVDDCSTDNSYDILTEYQKNNDIEIYKNIKNSGLAYTRNVGLKHAAGKYVMFVDSDDYIRADAIRGFIDKMVSDRLDILYFDVEEFHEEGSMIILSDKRKRKNSYKLVKGIDLFDAMVKNGEMFGCVWDGIYRREFLEDISLRFIDGILHEDIPFTFSALVNADRTIAISTTGYYYRQRNGSILHQPNYLSRAHGLIIGYSQMMIVWHMAQIKKDMAKYIGSISRYFNSVASMIRTNIRNGDNDCKEDGIVMNYLSNFQLNDDKELDEIVDEEIIRELRQYKKIAMYGAGMVATRLIRFFKQKMLYISEIYVTSKKDNQDMVEGIRVCEYKKELGKNCDAIVVAVSKTNQEQIVDTLLKMDYKGKIIVFPI